MGGCISVNKDSKARKSLPGSMAGVVKEEQKGKDETLGGFEYHVNPMDSSSKLGFSCDSFGSKEETFFDSKGWLDSDCEDDFFSVNGDFIPSGNSTPNFQINTPRTSWLGKPFIDTFPDTTLEPSPRKKLSELLFETLRDEEARTDRVNGESEEKNNEKSECPTEENLPSKSTEAAPNESEIKSSHERIDKIPNGNSSHGKRESQKATMMHCCLPRVVPSFNNQERKKSPKLQGNG